MWRKHGWRIKVLEVYNQRWFFMWLQFTFQLWMKDCLANHTTVRKIGSQPLNSSQPKGKVLFWLLVAEKGVKTSIQIDTLDYITNPSTNNYSMWSLWYDHWLATITLAPSIFPKNIITVVVRKWRRPYCSMGKSMAHNVKMIKTQWFEDFKITGFKLL